MLLCQIFIRECAVSIACNGLGKKANGQYLGEGIMCKEYLMLFLHADK